MGVTLIRSSYDPDPYPELGVHRFRLAVGLTDGESATERTKRAAAFSSPIIPVSGERHEGSQPAEKSFVRVKSGTVSRSLRTAFSGSPSGFMLTEKSY
jgi:alpha-mannosidase